MPPDFLVFALRTLSKVRSIASRSSAYEKGRTKKPPSMQKLKIAAGAENVRQSLRRKA
jgi:hypothetical protein